MTNYRAMGARRAAARMGLDRRLRLAFLGASMLALSAAAQAQRVEFNIPAQSVGGALEIYARQAGVQVMFPYDGLGTITSRPLVGTYDKDRALDMLIQGSGLEIVRGEGGIITLRQRSTQSSSAYGPSASPRVELASLNQREAAATPAGPGEQAAEATLALAAATAADDGDDEIIVTGTLIRGIAPESSPTQVYTQEDIQQSGVSTVEEFVDRLPQNFGGGSSAEAVRAANDRTTSNNVAGGAGVNLRGLGSGSTLVLLNGRRLAPSGALGDFVDISIIPVSALSRVEVVTDGASAIYGADAIGGVVNFRLRDDFEGLETFARYGAVTDGGLDEYRAGATAGTAWGSGSAMLSYDFYHRDNLGAEEREFSSRAALPNDLLPEQERHSVIVNLSQEVGDRVELRGHGLYGRRDSYRFVTNTTGITNRAVYDAESEQYGLSATAEVKLGGDWSAAFSGDYFDVTELQDATGLSPSTIANDSELWTVDALLNGTLLNLPGGAVKAAVGASYRDETFTSRSLPTGRLRAADDRSVKAVYGELFVPIIGPESGVPGIKRLELSLAGRYEDYSRFGDTFNPKVGAVWVPADGFKLRGSYGTSFNAPNLGDLGDTYSAVGAFIIPDPQSPTGTSVALFDFRRNPDLQPEEATTWSAGFDVERPLGGGSVTLSATYYDIDYDGRIATPGGSPLTYLSNPAFAAVVTRDPPLALVNSIIADARAGTGFTNNAGSRWRAPGDEDALINNRLRNQAADVTKGIDFRLAYKTTLAGGSLSASVDGSHVLSYKRQITPTSPVLHLEDTIFNPADFRLRGGLAWAGERVSTSLFVNHVGGYRDNRVTPNVPVDAWTTVDLSLGYDTGEREGASIIENTRFALSVLNLFDQEPPAIAPDTFGGMFGYDPTNASPLGRFVALQVTKRW